MTYDMKEQGCDKVSLVMSCTCVGLVCDLR